MTKVLQIRETPKTKCGGIDANCQAIYNAFMSDENIDMLPIKDYKLTEMPYLRSKYIPYKEVYDDIKKANPDIVHIHGSYTFTFMNVVRAAIRLKKKIVYSPHFHPFYSLARPKMGFIFFYMLTRPFLKYVDTVITINSEDTEWFKKYHTNVVRIPHWSKLNSEGGKVYKKNNQILFVGRINDSIKGIEHIYSLPEGKYDIHCVGKGSLQSRSDITQHINISDEELTKLYAESSLLVIPSRYEAFSYVAVEALSCNTPIVVSDRVRITDYFETCSYVGVFKYHDMCDFVNVVDQTIGQVVDVNHVRYIFDSERLKKRYKEIYR
jgi:glycosyltransferase involved in cell wall biosynthesis